MMEDTTGPDVAFYEVDMSEAAEMLDEFSWMEVLRKHVSRLGAASHGQAASAKREGARGAAMATAQL